MINKRKKQTRIDTAFYLRSQPSIHQLHWACSDSQVQISLNIEPAEEGKGPSLCIYPPLLLVCVLCDAHGQFTAPLSLLLPAYLRADGWHRGQESQKGLQEQRPQDGRCVWILCCKIIYAQSDNCGFVVQCKMITLFITQQTTDTAPSHGFHHVANCCCCCV